MKFCVIESQQTNELLRYDYEYYLSAITAKQLEIISVFKHSSTNKVVVIVINSMTARLRFYCNFKPSIFELKNNNASLKDCLEVQIHVPDKVVQDTRHRYQETYLTDSVINNTLHG